MSPTMKDGLIIIFLTAVAFAVAVQCVYTFGQLYHVAIMAYKSGGLQPRLVSFGRFGVYLYFSLAIVIALAMLSFIKSKGGVSRTKIATTFLILSLISTAAFAALVLLPVSEVVIR
ncbi:hypothetical protein [Dyella psychrodurans]|uniref:Uncharacterized protein n=1 Tax=Dyella psychrodurans TaxID=1927960 RepID=A0A370X7F6_9GAMM|nr:hypothetical protein [Dyella psychrodurans]RDS84296.1 hypothetical protein DWU99_11195 [Dyella psychrodurans]